MHKQPPKSAFQHPLFPPPVDEIIEASPGVRLNGNTETAWKLIADVSIRDGADVLVLALAIGCLCRALAERSGDGESGPIC